MTCQCDMHGRQRYHCRACCLTFTSVSAFDQHIIKGIHRQPQERGLVLTRDDLWGWPDSGRSRGLPEQSEAS